MTKGRITLLSTIITLLLSPISAQTGEGCYGRLRPCPAGQVRLNAQISASGAFQGGCTCGCPPQLADPASANYCNAPRTVNFDAATMQGNCQCTCPPDVTAATCKGRQLWHESKCGCECPSWMPATAAADCTAPQVFLPELCECGCPQGSVYGPCTATINGATSFIPGSHVTEQCTCDTSGVICDVPAHSPDPTTGICACPEGGAAAPGGGFYPICELPQIQDPITCDCVTTTTTAPPFGAPQVANCESVGACDGCHPGTTGTCTINCDVGNDACKDGTITCGNTGADCIVNCVTGSACAGAAKIIGPTGGGSLIVNCLGGQSCEGAVTMDASASTKQLIVDCQGSQACKGSLNLQFGALGGKLTCAGAPDSCQGMGAGSFTLPVGIETTPMASFECVGQFCPPAAPANFNNVPQNLRPPPVAVNPTIPVAPPTLFPPIVNPIIIPGPSAPQTPNTNPQFPPLVNPQPPVPVPQQPILPTPAPILILPPGVTPPNIPGMPPIPFIHSGDIPPGGLPQIPIPAQQPPPVLVPPYTPITPINPNNPSPPNQIPPPVTPVANPNPNPNPNPNIITPPANPPPGVPPPPPIPVTNPQFPNNPVPPNTGIPPPQPPIIPPPGIPQPPQMPIWMPPVGVNPQPAPGTGGSQGGTLIINTGNQPIPIVRPDEEVICEGTGGECACTGTRSCTIKCETQDACKEKIISCPMHHDCTVVCSGDASCISSTINAPQGKDLTVNCAGLSACADSTFSARETVNTAYTCSAKDSCKGSTTINCGSGQCEVSCLGEASCDSATIAVNRAISFACSGAQHCPAQFTSPPVPIPTIAPSSPCAGYTCTCGNALQCFSNPSIMEGCNCVCPDLILQQAMLSDPALICGVSNGAQVFNPRTCGCDCPPTVNRNCPPTQVFNQNKCQCECPGGNECPGASIMNPETCNCECPAPRLSPSDCGALGRVLRNCQCACQQECAGPGQIQDLRTCGCACPAGTPLSVQCPSGVLDELMCECAPEIQSPYCCHPRIEAMTMWNGRCFGRASEADCAAEPLNRCTWKGPSVDGVENATPDCLDNPPRWPRGTGPICSTRLHQCMADEQCCSGICLMDGTCL